jgi:hypothetical protein
MSEYTSIPSSGKLKLKGSSSGITKKKKKKHANTDSKADNAQSTKSNEDFQDNSVVLKPFDDERISVSKDKEASDGALQRHDTEKDHAGTRPDDEQESRALKTDAERRFAERRKQMVSKQSFISLAHLSFHTPFPIPASFHPLILPTAPSSHPIPTPTPITGPAVSTSQPTHEIQPPNRNMPARLTSPPAEILTTPPQIPQTARGGIE